jgi:alkylhydroperoxidase family enzyme
VLRFEREEEYAMAGLDRLDPERHRQHGYGHCDTDIWDIAAVTSFFNISNRMAAATDMMPNAEVPSPSPLWRQYFV